MLEESLSYPTDDDTLVETYLIGSLLLLVTGVVGITVIPLYGYYLRAFEDGRTGDPGLPEFDDWGELVVDGLKLFLVNLVYTGIAGAALGIGITFLTFAFVFGVAAESAAVVLVGALLAGLLILVFGAIVLVGSYLVPAAVGLMLETDDVGAAFRLRTVVAIGKHREYATAVLLAWVVGFVVLFVGGLLSLVLIGLPIVFYGGLVTFNLFGRGYGRARASGVGDGDASESVAESV